METAKYSLTKKNYERSSLLFEQGVISKMEFENEKLKFLQAQQSIEGIKITISQLEDGAKNLQKTKKNVNINCNLIYKYFECQIIAFRIF